MQAQTPPTVPLPLSPQVLPAAAPLDTLGVALAGAAAVILSAAAAYAASYFVRRGLHEKTQAEFDVRAQSLKADIEAQIVKDRDTLRDSLMERIEELKREIGECRAQLLLKDTTIAELRGRVETLEKRVSP